MAVKPKSANSLPLVLTISGCFILLGVWLALRILSAVSSPSNINPVKATAPLIPTSSAESTLQKVPKEKRQVYTPQVTGYRLRVPILMYHYIGNNPNPTDLARNSLSVSPDKFEEQMKYLADNGYTSISLDTLYAALTRQITLPSKAIVLTFDDGYVDFYVNAYPILRQYGLHATEFIPTGLMNQGYYLHWDQIKEMFASGLISFEAHTVHHYNLPSYSRETVLHELTESKKILQEQLGVPVNFIAYPNGATNNEIIELTRQAGYVGAAGTWASEIQSEGTIYNMPRLRISGSITLQDFVRLL